MRYLSDEQVKKELDINSFREISKEKMIQFVSMLPEMDKELAIKIIEQFPEFRQFAKDAFEVLQNEYKLSLESNAESQLSVFENYRNVQRILENELDREGLTFEQRKEIICFIIDIADKCAKLDGKNKEFIFGLQKMHVNAIGTVVILGLIFLGGKMLDNSISDKDDKKMVTK